MSQTYEDHIRSVEDFPKQGVRFYDIAPLLGNGAVFSSLIEDMARPLEGRVSKVAAFDARGFIFGGAVANHLGVGFTLLRKPGKLPGDVEKVTYGLEYGNDQLEVQTNTFTSSDKVVLIDDVVATGGTALAGLELVQAQGAEVVEFCTVIDVPSLKGSDRIRSLGVPVRALVELGAAS